MSPRNWRTCPHCRAVATQRRNEDRHAIKESYGKVSPEEYEKRLAHWNADESDKEENLREDYDIGMDEDGKFCVSYGCFCTVCGWSHEFTHESQRVINPQGGPTQSGKGD